MKRTEPRRHATMTRGWLRRVLVILLFFAVAQQSRATKTKSSASSCLVVDGLDRAFNYSPTKWTPNTTSAMRFVTANHKTGTLFAKCLCGILETSEVDGKSVPCGAGGYRHRFQGLQHTRGKGLSSQHFCLNMVRNPFIMVHSGLQYHTTTNSSGERWLYERMNGPRAKQTGLTFAAAHFAALCRPGQPTLNLSESYQENLKLLPLNDSLILEALRAVSADIANMIIAAKRCGEVDDVAATQSPRTGGCQNLLVDSMTPNFESGFRKFIAPALNVSTKLAGVFAERCDPFSATASAKDQTHTTPHGQQREEAIKILRELDELHLGGVLRTAENILSSLVMKP